jgi:hypothetical protein
VNKPDGTSEQTQTNPIPGTGDNVEAKYRDDGSKKSEKITRLDGSTEYTEYSSDGKPTHIKKTSAPDPNTGEINVHVDEIEAGMTGTFVRKFDPATGDRTETGSYSDGTKYT